MLMITAALGLAAAVLFSAMGYRRTSLLRVVSLGIVIYISLYLVVSGLLLQGGCFTMQRSTAILLPILLLGIAYRKLRYGGGPAKIDLQLKQSAPLAIILLLAALISWGNHSQAHNTGQDEGLYQMRAMYYIGGQYDGEISFPEYRLINGRWDRSNFRENFENMYGFYQEEWDPVWEYPSGVLHGIPTFPALLALWGKIFGLSAMQGVLVLCYLMSIVNVWLILGELMSGRTWQCMGTLMYAASPIVLWNAKNTLVEIVLALLLSGFFLLLCEDGKRNALLTALPLAGVCFTHIMVTMLMPMLVLLYVINYLFTKKRAYVFALILTVIAYAAGFTMMYAVARSYMDSNMMNLYSKLHFLMNSDNAVVVVWGIAAFCTLASLVAERLLRDKKIGSTEPGKIPRILMKVVLILCIGVILIHAIRFIGDGKVMHWLPRLMITGVAIMTGFLFLPAGAAATVGESDRLLKDRRFASITFSVYYTLVMLGVLLWTVVREYYYYARYLTPYIFLVILLAGYAVKKLPRVATVAGTLALIALTVLLGPLPYTAQDLTYANYEVIENIAACVGEKDAVLIYEQGYGIHRIYTLPIKALTGADVYYLNPDHPMQQVNAIRPDYEHLYVLQYYQLGIDPLADEEMIEVYRGDIRGTFYEMDEDAKDPLFPTVLADMSEVLQLRMFDFEEKK